MTRTPPPPATWSALRRGVRQHPLAVVAAGAQVVALVLLAADLVAVSVGRGDEQLLRMIGVAAVTAASAAATVLTALVGRAGLGNRRYLTMLTWAFGFATFGGISGMAELAKGGPAHLGLHDLAFLVGAVVVTIGVLRHPDLGPPRRRARVVVDSVITALSLAAVLWLAGGRALVDRGEQPLRSMAVVMAVAALLAVTRTGLIISLSSRRSAQGRSAASLVTIGFACLGVGGLSHLLTHLWPSAALLALGDVALVAGFITIGVTGLLLLGDATMPTLSLPRRRTRWLLDLAPILASAVAMVAVLADAARRGQFDATASAVLTVVICSVLLRQSLTLSDNRELSTSLRATVDDLERQATHDALTGLPNRIGLPERIDAAAASARASGRVCAVYFIDVDHLKTVNDTLGHGAGDALIRCTADRLRARVGDRVTRFGGDEFVVVVEDLASPGAAASLGQQLVDDTSLPVSLDGAGIRSSTSVGLNVVDEHTPADEVLRRADVALYGAKGLGRRCVSVYRPADDTGRDVELDLEPELRRAVRADEFVLAYQPIVELESGEAVSVEALLRWQHPTRGLLGPDVFLDAAIDTGLLGSIGATSLRRACADFAAVTDALGGRPPSVAVNLSSSELADRRVVSRVSRALDESGLAPQRLTLEITEDVIVDDTVRATIDELSALDVHLAIDDFGTGNSSLRQLGAYPADVLKIDRSFVERLEHDERARAVTSAIVRLAGNLGLTTLAEGVETEGQARLLAGMGCDRAQGWLFSAALPLDELVEWWTGRTPVGYRDRRASVASASSMMRVSSSATGGRSSIAPTT
jgi:diguanylate cyclase (GGDEF)-like protein